jgi:hypothetical protein
MKAWQDNRVLVAAYVIAALLAGIHKYWLPQKTTADGVVYYQYNNYVIFERSCQHLIDGQNLYAAYPHEHMDLFKYSPAFAAAMWPLAQLPDVLGLCLWNIANALILLWAIRSLPLPPTMTALAAWLVWKDQLTSLQNTQSNSIVAALMIFTVIAWERERLAAAAVAVAMSFYLKIFGLAAAMLWIVYPHKFRSLVWCVLATVAIGCLPLLLTSPSNTIDQYSNWFTLLNTEYPASEGISVMGILHAWFGYQGSKLLVVAIGGIMLVAPLLHWRRHGELEYRLGLLASAMIWVVLFNHRAESATFIVATTGVAIWFVSRPITRLNIALMTMTVLLSGFSSNDLVPDWVQLQVIDKYHLKALPALLVWLKIQTELWTPGSQRVVDMSSVAQGLSQTLLDRPPSLILERRLVQN